MNYRIYEIKFDNIAVKIEGIGKLENNNSNYIYNNL